VIPRVLLHSRVTIDNENYYVVEKKKLEERILNIFTTEKCQMLEERGRLA
jgi:hypothetical protein